jgi:diketogulonate reductase-like aldo/keto reductase
MSYTHQNAVIVIPKSSATYRHRHDLRADGFECDGKQWQRTYDNSLYLKWANRLRREPDGGDWPVRRMQQLGLL